MVTIPRDVWEPELPLEASYIRGQPEIGESGYRHWQVLVQYPQAISLTHAKRSFPTQSHLEPARAEAALAYVWKEDTRDGTPFEFGTRAMRRNSRTDWAAVWLAATEGRLLDIPESIRVRSYFTISRIAQDFARPLAMERSAVCYWGPTGSGKSRRAFEEAVDCYSKDPRTKWWSGYGGQRNVVVDEFRGDIDISHILRWTDRYPVSVETKGGSQPLCAVKFWFTSNLHPSAWYPLLDPLTYAALERRLEIIEIQ